MATLTSNARQSLVSALANEAAATEIRGILEATSPGSPDGDFGGSGTAGSVDVFPATASKGKISIVAANNAGDTTLTITNASQAGSRTYTIPDAGATTANFILTAGAQTLASKTLTAPIIVGCTASGSTSNDFSGSTGTFKTSTGANTLGGAVTVNDATTPSVSLATGKTNTGFFLVNGKTSGSFKIITHDSTAQAVVMTVGAQTSGGCTLTIPDQAGVSSSFVFTTLAQTLTNKTLTSPVINTPVTTRKVTAKTADYTVVAATDSGQTFTTVGAAGTVTFALPAATVGQNYRFRVGAAQECRLDPNGTETIALPSTGVQGAAGKYLTADADGESVEIECTKTGQWTVYGFTGTWTAEG